MPQMKPMNWLILFILLNMILLFMNIMNYYMKNFLNNKNNLIINKNFKNWSW